MAELKEKLRADLTDAIKRRDAVVMGTLRMALSAVRTEEVAGKQERELTDEEVRRVLAREAKKRDESAAAFRSAGREEQADSEARKAWCCVPTYPLSSATTNSKGSSTKWSPRWQPSWELSRGRSRWARS